MAKTQSLYELKQAGMKKKNPNTITDADYFLRDKEEEAQQGYPNSIDTVSYTHLTLPTNREV